MNRALTIQRVDMWHPQADNLDTLDWPEHWGMKFRDA